MSKIVSLLLGMGFLLMNNHPVFADSGLQQIIDATPQNGLLELQGEIYEGNIIITKPITMISNNNTVIKGNRTGNVIEVKSSGVHIEGVTVTNSGMDRNSGEEYAAIKLFEGNNVLKKITITNSFHGVYISQSHGNDIRQIHVNGLNNGEIAGQGNGIHLYYSNNNTLSDNTMIGTRDGMFFDNSNENTIINNDVTRARYGLHFMYSNENSFIRNRFSFNTAGAAVMFSHRNLLNENEFSLNQGSRSFGLLLQSSDDNLIKNNMFYQNLRGIYIDQSQNNRIENNKMIQNHVGIEIWASSSNQVFIENVFDRNVATVLSLGGHSNNDWNENGRGNSWGASFPLLDLDRNGIGDSPVQYMSSLYRLVEENELTYLFLKSPAIKLYEKMNEVFNRDQVMLIDDYPLIREIANNNLVERMAIPLIVGFLIVLFVVAKRRSGR